MEECNHCGHVFPPSLKLCLLSELKKYPHSLTLLTLPFSVLMSSLSNIHFSMFMCRSLCLCFPSASPELSFTFLCLFPSMSKTHVLILFKPSMGQPFFIPFSNDFTPNSALSPFFIKFLIAWSEFQLSFSPLIVIFRLPLDLFLCFFYLIMGCFDCL